MTPGLDMDGSLSGSSNMDYSDFDYQEAHASLVLGEEGDTTGSGNATAQSQHVIEPLGDAAGLDNNEVAELVYLEVQTMLEFEGERGDQNVGSTYEQRGHVGINLPAAPSAFIDTSGSNPTDPGTIISTDDISEDEVFAQTVNRTDDRYLQTFRNIGGAPFDDEASGAGGGTFTTIGHHEKAYRNLTGRGPVLDANDDITVVQKAIAGDTVIDFSANVNLKMYWDVAETSDAGRAFSVPDM